VTVHENAKSETKRDLYVSTSYSNKIACGICGSPLRNVPAMYEDLNIDWRCGKCLRRDKSSQEDRAA
jgi:hypothetical protein